MWEGPPEDRLRNRSYYIDGKPKLFQLGTETHFLSFANNDIARFGFGNGLILNHPSPNFELVFEHEGSYSNLSATNFKINGSSEEVNYTREVLWKPYWTENPFVDKFYFVSQQALEIGNGETVTFSCTILPDEPIISDVFVLVNWSPDGNIRYFWVTLVEQVTFMVPTTTTSVTLTSTSASSETTDGTSTTTGTPGFTVLTVVLLVIPLLTQKLRKKGG